MRIQVNGKQLDVGDALRSHVEGQIAEALTKYSEKPIEAVVTFSRDGHEFRCDASAHISTGLTAKAQGRAGDIYAAADGCVDRLEKQLRRYKRRLKDHHKDRDNGELPLLAASYVLASSAEEEETAEADGQPVVIAEMKAEIHSLSVGDAVMRMELTDQPFLLFRNPSTEGLNLIYRRDDGNIGWIDPANLSKVN